MVIKDKWISDDQLDGIKAFGEGIGKLLSGMIGLLRILGARSMGYELKK